MMNSLDKEIETEAGYFTLQTKLVSFYFRDLAFFLM